jgi:hypothetical protein
MTRSRKTGDRDSQTPTSASKVAKLIRRYDLEDLGDELEDRWTREEDRMSLRALADYFNKELLSAVLGRTTTNILDGEAENYYRLLTDDGVSSGSRIQAENKLEQHGIDVEDLRSNFVSRQAIHTYLTKERESSYDREDQTTDEQINDRMNTIRQIKSRLAAISEQTLSDLARSNHISSGDADVTVLIQATCDRCGTQYSITEFISNGGCDCDENIASD